MTFVIQSAIVSHKSLKSISQKTFVIYFFVIYLMICFVIIYLNILLNLPEPEINGNIAFAHSKWSFAQNTFLCVLNNFLVTSSGQ